MFFIMVMMNWIMNVFPTTKRKNLSIKVKLLKNMYIYSYLLEYTQI